jgi:hypothetical protein
MNATGTITMTMREVDRFKVIQAVTDRRRSLALRDDSTGRERKIPPDDGIPSNRVVFLTDVDNFSYVKSYWSPCRRTRG